MGFVAIDRGCELTPGVEGPVELVALAASCQRHPPRVDLWNRPLSPSKSRIVWSVITDRSGCVEMYQRHLGKITGAGDISSLSNSRVKTPCAFLVLLNEVL